MTTNKKSVFYRKVTVALAFTFTLLMSMTAAQAANETTVNIGTKTDGTPVQATNIDFGKRIYNIVSGPDKEHLLVMFREKDSDTKEWMMKGEMGLYSMKSHELKWVIPFNYSYKPVFGQKRIYACAKGRTIAYEIETGQKLWKDWNYLTRIDEKNDVLLGYETDEPGISKMYIINMLTNKVIAKTKIPHDKCWGWNDVIRQDDNHIIVLANNLNRVNLQTGEQQTIETKAGVIDAGKAVLNGLLWMGAGMVPVGGAILQYGLFYPASVSRNATTALHSNICQSGSLYYFADSEHLMCFDGELNVRWSIDLPEKAGSHSTLLLRDNTLYLLNYGYGESSTGKQKKMGQPFMAAYDAGTGKNIYMNLLTIDRDFVKEAHVTPEGSLMMFDNGLAYNKTQSDATVNITPWDIQKYGELSHIMRDTVYVCQTGGHAFQTICASAAGCPVETVTGDVCMVDQQLNIRDTYPLDIVYRPLAKTDNYTLVYHSEPTPELWFISKDGHPEMKITVPISTLTIVGKTICLQSNNKLLLL